jgi:hypothetical protein
VWQVPKDKSGKEPKETKSPAPGDATGDGAPEQNIPEEVLQQLPPEVKAQLGYKEEEKPIFRGPSGAGAGLSDSIDRLREGFEKIGLTLIGRMGEFASTLERVVMTVARIEKVEKSTAETTYFLKNLQKTLDEFKRDFNKVVDKIGSVEIDVERIANEMTGLKSQIAAGSIPQPSPQQPARPTQMPPLVTKPQPTPTAQPVASPVQTANTPVSAPQMPPAPQAPSTPSSTPANTPTTAAPQPNSVASIFSNLKGQAKVGANSNSIADLLDQAREQISATCKWTPAIYEIGKLARKLRKDNTTLTQNDEIEISQLLDQWKNQITQA